MMLSFLGVEVFIDEIGAGALGSIDFVFQSVLLLPATTRWRQLIWINAPTSFLGYWQANERYDSRQHAY
jgi:hypothetical protein